jgi:hypothetical protein
MTAISKAEASRRAAEALARARENCPRPDGQTGFETRVEFVRWLSQPEQLGVEAPDESSYNRWEEGTVRAPLWFFVAVAEMTRLRPDQLLGLEPLGELPAGTLERLERLEGDVAEIKQLAARIQPLLERRRRRTSSENPEVAAGS